MDNRQGIVFHIIHGSFVDGFGIRTTLFLKGCPLRCVWCCNPEGQKGHLEIKLDTSKCDGCGRCIDMCPVGAIKLDPQTENNVVEIDRGLCTNCGKCIDVCYTGALDYFGRYYDVDELFDIIKKDEQFYRTSGGGVSIGGGEPTFQPSFTYSLLKKCKENYIHTAIDTCGYTLTEEGLQILKEADLLLFDVKIMAPEKHLEYTGVTNDKILSNLKMLDSLGKPIIIRVPMIAGYTDSTENINITAEFLSKLKSVVRVDLLSYHEFGTIKYRQLGKEYLLNNTQSVTEKCLNNIKDDFQRYGLEVQVGG